MENQIPKHIFLLSISLIFLFASQSLWHAKDKSATVDESVGLTVSYLLWKTDHLDYDIQHTPLIRFLFAIPLLWMNPSLPSHMPLPVLPRSVPLVKQKVIAIFTYGATFLFRTNRTIAEKLLLSSRGVNIILGCLLGFWIFQWSKRLYGDIAGIISLGFFALCPNLIAHSSLVTSVGGVTFAVGFLYCLTVLTERNTAKWTVFSGILLGAALLSRYTNIFLIPLFVLSFFFLSRSLNRNYLEIFKTTALVLLIGWFVLCAGYKFQDVFTSHTLHEEDWKNFGYGKTVQTLYRYAPLPDSFMRGLGLVINHNQRGHDTYLLGNHSMLGWWYYFPIVFLVKTPTVTLILLIAWMSLLVMKRIRLTSRDQKNICIPREQCSA